MSRKMFPVLFCVALIPLQACLQSTAPLPATVPLEGSWRYTASQATPVRESLSGVMVIEVQSGSSLQGTIEMVATNQQTGQSRTISGPVSGTAAEAHLIDMDAALELSIRRHVGSLVGDTIAGSWVATGNAGVASSGTFRAEKIR